MIEFKKPRFWDFKKPNFIAHLLLPLTIPLIISNFFLGLKKKKKDINHNVKLDRTDQRIAER